MSSETVPRRLKPPVESELSQILAHARACREAFGPYLGALVVVVTVVKARQGYVGIATFVSVAGTVAYNMFLK